MAGVESMKPLCQVGFQPESLLPLQLRPSCIEQAGELRIYFEEIGVVPAVVVKFVDQRPGIDVFSVQEICADINIDFHGSGGQATKTIFQPFPA